MRGSPPSTVPTSCRFACLGEVCKCDTTCPFESAFFAPQMARECEGGMRHRTAVVHAPELLHCQEHVYIIAGHGNAGSGCTVRVGCAAWRVHVCVCVCVGVCLFSRVPIFFALSSLNPPKSPPRPPQKCHRSGKPCYAADNPIRYGGFVFLPQHFTCKFLAPLCTLACTEQWDNEGTYVHPTCSLVTLK
jgi:hypothetical protein